MSPKTVSERRLRPLPSNAGLRPPPFPTGAELGLGMMSGLAGFMMSSLVEQFLSKRKAEVAARLFRNPLIDAARWTLEEPAFANVAEMERAFGINNTAPLSPEQASTFKRSS